MLKPINLGPLNASRLLGYKCEKCGSQGTMFLTNRVIHTDNQGGPIEPLGVYECPKCGERL